MGGVGPQNRRAAGLVVTAVFLTLVSCSDALLQEMNAMARDSNSPKSVSPASVCIIPAHEIITVQFKTTMDPATVTVTGNIGTASMDWTTTSSPNDTLILNKPKLITDPPTIAWNAGSARTLTLTVATGGQTVSYTYTYNVFKGVCVSTAGNDGNTGTAVSPMQHIGAAITYASTLYAAVASEVHIATGTYATNWKTSTNTIQMVEGVSVFGGYDTSFQSWDPASNPTTIADGSAAGLQAGTCNCAVYADTTITTATTLKGFTITGGLGTMAAAVYCYGGSPTIADNTINAGGDESGGATHSAILLDLNGSTNPSPHITGNSINLAASAGGVTLAECDGIYVNAPGAPVIEGNLISGGTALSSAAGGYCYGIQDGSSGLSVIRANTIWSGTSRNAYAVKLRSKPSAMTLTNNLIRGANGYGGTGGICYALYINNCSPVVRNNTVLIESTYGTETKYALYLASSAHPTLQNNLFEIFNTLYTSYSIYEASGCTPTLLKNNHLYNAQTSGAGPIYYRASTATTYYPATLTTLETDLGGAAVAGANATGDPFLDSGFVPTGSSPTAILSGGLDGASLSWGFTTNRNGATRTGNGSTGWTMGCY